jgi:hypothetical protein
MREPVPVDLTVETIAFAKVDSTNWFQCLLSAQLVTSPPSVAASRNVARTSRFESK